MSQAKVDKYKKEKANRKKTMAKQRMEKIAGIVCGCAVLVAIAGWAGYTGYRSYENNKPAQTYYTDASALSEYLQSLNTQE